jgi:hypothetical protein
MASSEKYDMIRKILRLASIVSMSSYYTVKRGSLGVVLSLNAGNRLLLGRESISFLLG